MTPTLSNDLLGRLSGWATAEFGLRFPPDRWSELARGVASAALELGIPDLEGWAEMLVSGVPDRGHVATVANHLTISETYFFRQRDTFALLEQTILPTRIVERRKQVRTLRIWSAGCASGEEPYSIAILLRQRFSGLPVQNVMIAATDINSRVLGRAERGVYSEWSFRDVPDWVKTVWFRRKGSSRYELVPEIRRMVRFEPLNLAAPRYPAEFGDHADFDVILCRNVLMYFSAEWQEKIIRRFAEGLTEGGWLIVGPCDITAAQSAALQLESHSAGVYRKVTTGPRRSKELLTTLQLPPSPWSDGLAPPVLPGLVGAAASARIELPAPMPLVTPAVAPLAPAPGLTPAATDGDVASAVAQQHADRGELDAALAACDEAIALDKTNPNYHHLRACILQEQNRLGEAAEAFRRVLFLEPGTVMAEFALGCLAQREGRREPARHHFSNVLRLLAGANRGDAVPGSDGLTVARLRAVVEHNLTGDAT